MLNFDRDAVYYDMYGFSVIVEGGILYRALEETGDRVYLTSITEDTSLEKVTYFMHHCREKSPKRWCVVECPAFVEYTHHIKTMAVISVVSFRNIMVDVSRRLGITSKSVETDEFEDLPDLEKVEEFLIPDEMEQIWPDRPVNGQVGETGQTEAKRMGGVFSIGSSR